MRPGRSAGIAHTPNHLTRRDKITFVSIYPAQMNHNDQHALPVILNDGIKGKKLTMANNWTEPLVKKPVTYTLNLNGKIFLIDNVPARVNEETGEQFFSPSIVERLQQTILDSNEPDRFIQVPVYDYSNSAA